jgi:hypothetical protein
MAMSAADMDDVTIANLMGMGKLRNRKIVININCYFNIKNVLEPMR